MTEAYLHEVADRLTLSWRARQQSLDDLRDLLSDPRVTLDDLGSPAEYATTLNEQLRSSADRFLGIPVSLPSGLGRRIAGTFDPADERLLIPRLFGIGWTLNMGRIAVALGLMNPDDVDNDVLDDAAENLGESRLAASVLTATAGGSAALLASRRPESETALGKSLLGSVVFGTLLPIVSAALIAASTDRELPAAQRLTMPAVAASLSTISGATCLQQAVRPHGSALAASGALLALPIQLALSYLPVRAALRRGWTKEHHA